MANDDAQRHALAERMSSLLGLPATQIEQLIPLIAAADLQRLDGMGDAEFLRESTKLINEAQRRQLEDMERQASATAHLKTVNVPASEASTPKLRPLRRPGDAPVLKPVSASAPSSSAGGTDETDDVPRDAIGGLRKVGAVAAAAAPAPPVTSSGIIDDAPERAGAPQIDPLTGSPVSSGFLRNAPVKSSDGLSFTPTAHTSHGESEPEGSGKDAPVVARAEMPAVRESDDNTAEAKIPQSFVSRQTRKSGSATSRNALLIRAGLGLVAVIIVGMGVMLAYMIFFPAETTDTVIVPPPPDDEVATDTSVSSVPPLNDVPVTTDTDVVDSATPPPPAGPERSFALRVDDAVELRFAPETILSEQTQFTVEAWVKVRRGMEVQSLHVIGGDEEPPVFRFGLGQGDFAGLQLQFSVPEAMANIVAPPPEPDRWTHIAGVYDPYRAMNLSLYIDGRLVQQTDLPQPTRLKPRSLIVRMQTATSGALLVDEIRVTRGVLYTDRFTPERYLLHTDATALLLATEPDADHSLELSDSVSGTKVAFTGAAWLSLADESVDAALILELPESLLDQFARDNGEAARRELVQKWAVMTDDEKRAFLSELGLK